MDKKIKKSNIKDIDNWVYYIQILNKRKKHAK
jgi:hypothetical protein